MKAVQYKTHGAPAEVMEVVDVEPPELAPGEARVDVVASPINPVDMLTLSGQYAILPPLPAVAGSEGLGRVVEVAPGGDGGVQVGQLVVLPLGAGAWQQQLAAPAAQLTPLPDGADPHQLAMLAINPPTALLMLDSIAKLSEGDWVVQNAANSAVGVYLIQLARRRGVRTANVVRREGLEDELTAQGADAVFVDGPDLAERVQAHTGGARLGIDAIGGEATARIADCLADGGVAVNYGVLSGEACQVSPVALIFRGIRLQGFWVAQWIQDTPADERAKVYGELTELIADGTLHAPVEEVYSIEDAKAAVEHAMQGGRSGKILIAPNG